MSLIVENIVEQFIIRQSANIWARKKADKSRYPNEADRRKKAFNRSRCWRRCCSMLCYNHIVAVLWPTLYGIHSKHQLEKAPRYCTVWWRPRVSWSTSTSSSTSTYFSQLSWCTADQPLWLLLCAQGHNGRVGYPQRHEGIRMRSNVHKFIADVPGIDLSLWV
jgi:hypothetical protein